MQLQHNVCPAHQLTIDIDLRESGPVTGEVEEQVDVETKTRDVNLRKLLHSLLELHIIQDIVMVIFLQT